MSEGYIFKQVETTEDNLEEISKLLCRCFPNEKKFTVQFLDWQYNQNPEGKIIGFNAYLNNTLVAHYVVMPINMMFEDKERKGLLSLNTATHPDHQGKGLFTQLAQRTYDKAKSSGFEFVIGVANKNSFPGFVNKLGFQHLGDLEARLGIGKIERSKKSENPKIAFRKWNKESIAWRISNPSNDYFISYDCVFSNTDKSMISALLVENQDLFGNTTKGKDEPAKIKLWIGSDPEIDWKKSKYYNIPSFLRPSPLHLIYKELIPSVFNPTIQNIKFLLFDFDAY